MDDAIRRTLADIASFLAERGTSFALIGGIAVAVRGEPRFTADVDLVISADVDAALELLESTHGSTFAPLFDGADEVVRKSFILPLRHRETGIKLDIAVGLTGFERQLVSRAPLESMGAFSIPVATPEDLLLMKALAARPRDIDDARSIVEKGGATLDWEYILDTGRELGQAIEQDLAGQLRALREGR